MKVLFIVVICIVACGIFLSVMTMGFKIGYYEQTLKNNKDKFSHDRWEHIERVMKKKTPF